MQTCIVPAGTDGPVDESFRSFTARLSVLSQHSGKKNQTELSQLRRKYMLGSINCLIWFKEDIFSDNFSF